MFARSQMGLAGSGANYNQPLQARRQWGRANRRDCGNAAFSVVEKLEERKLLSNTFTVTNLNDSGPGSLREAISDANGAATPAADPVVTWNNVAMQAVLDVKTDGVTQERALAMMHLAQFDALDSIEQRYAEYSAYSSFLPNAAGASPSAAADQAAHDVLSSTFPADKAMIDSALASSFSSISDGASKTAGIALGKAAAARIIAQRANDHYFDTVAYTPGTKPGDWQPTGTAQKPAAFTQVPFVTPFALQSPSQFRTTLPGPPALGSQAFADAVNQVKDLGSATSTTRTADQSNIAKFWYLAGGTTNQTPGEWNKITQAVLTTRPMNMLDEARLFSLLNMGQFDTLTTTFDIKYVDNFWRPETAIHLANTAGHSNSYTNTGIVGDPNWTPFLPAPNFPSYVSNHAALDAAAAKVLQDAFGTDNISFTVPTQGFAVPDRSFTSFSQAAVEGAMSRIYAGIHYSFDATDGLALGQRDQTYIDANQFAPQEATVTFAPGLHGTITLTSGQLTVTGDVAVKGPGARQITVSGNNASRVFQDIGPHGNLDISGLTIANGMAPNGAGVDNAGGTGSLTDVVLSGNQAVGAAGADARGAGLYNETGGTFTVTDSLFMGNQSHGGSGGGNGSGGGVYNLGTITITGTTFRHNQGIGGNGGSKGLNAVVGEGGAISNISGGQATLSDDLIDGNQAIGGTTSNGAGGAIANDLHSTMSVSDSVIENNLSLGGASGGRALGGTCNAHGSTMTLSNDKFIANQAIGGDGGTATGVPAVDLGAPLGQGAGGAILNAASATLTVSNTSFIGNLAEGGNGGNGGTVKTASAVDEADGGGIFNAAGATLTGNHISFIGNRAVGGSNGVEGIAAGNVDAALGGGLFNGGSTASLTGATVIGNSATGGNNATANLAGGFYGLGAGGGILNVGGSTLTVDSSTISRNWVLGGKGGSGTLGAVGGDGHGGGLGNAFSSKATVTNTVISRNAAMGGTGANGAAGGLAQGGGLVNGAGSTGTFSNVVIDRNSVTGGEGGEGAVGGNALGGGIANGAALTLSASSVSRNEVTGGVGDDAVGGDGLGGGIYDGPSGMLTLKGTSITRNEAEGGEGDEADDGSGIGGGLYIDPAGVVSIDMASAAKKNRASSKADNTFGTYIPI